MRIACFVVCIVMCCRPTLIMGQEGAMRYGQRPEFPAMPVFAADGVVHILPSTMPESSTLTDSRPDRCLQRGFALKALIARLYQIDEGRVEFADAALAARRYDVSVAVPKEEPEEAIRDRVKEALRRTLHVAIVTETRTMEVYAVSSPQGPGPEMKAIGGGVGIGGSGLSLSVMRPANGAAAAPGQMQWTAGKITGGAVTSGSLSVGGPIKFFCGELERVMDRPVVDETGLAGAYDIRLRWDQLDQQGFFKKMHEELGLVTTPELRAVSQVVVRGE